MTKRTLPARCLTFAHTALRSNALRLTALLLVTLLPMSLAACDDGMDKEEATEICSENRKRLNACFDDAVMAECVACHEDCGVDCTLVDGPRCGWTCD
jgi:hypothetical protein